MAFNPQSLDTRAASDAGVFVTLKDVEGNEVWADGKPVQFRLVGRDSAVAKEAFSLVDGKSGDALTAASEEALSKCVKGWSDNIEGDDGKPLAFNKENLAKLIAIPHIGEWLLGEVMRRANFTTKPRSK